jgi:hypothetical protein
MRMNMAGDIHAGSSGSGWPRKWLEPGMQLAARQGE